MSKELWKNGSGIGNVLVFVYSKQYSITQDALKRISKEYSDVRTFYSSRECSIYYLDCLYTIEDKLYPILREMRSIDTFAENRTFIACFALFADDLYTEQFLITKDTDSFSVGTLTETTADAIREEEDAFDRAAELFLQKYSVNDNAEEFSLEEALDKAKFQPSVRINVGEKFLTGKDPASLSTIRPAFMAVMKRIASAEEREVRDEVIDRASTGEGPVIHVAAGQIGHTYFFNKEGKVYVVDAFTMEHCIPYYLPFVVLFFQPKNGIKDILSENAGIYILEDGTATLFPIPVSLMSKESRDFNIWRDNAYRALVEEFCELAGGKING